MPPFSILLIFLVAHSLAVSVDENSQCQEPLSKCVISTKVFTMKVEPQLFKWNVSAQRPDRYSYRPSLFGSPDLPSWMQYVYSKTHHSGFVFGTPPAHQSDFTLEIVAVDLESYNTSQKVIKFLVLPRKEHAQFQLHLKIDNLSIEDMFEPQYLEDLLSVFRNELWLEAWHDLHVTFFTSAVQLGARLPLRPEEKEGVVVHLGSAEQFSESLLRLENETRPLRKSAPCPRDFKRTSVDRLFRQLNFEMDWCAFRLSSEGHHHKEDTSVIKDMELSFSLNLPMWHGRSQWDAPERSYIHEFLLSILVPMLVMIVLAILLSLILCFHHEGMDDGSSDYFESIFDICEDVWGNKRNQETPAIQMVRYAAVQRATSTLRSLSTQRDSSPALSRLAQEGDNVLRPHPPPYNSSSRSSKIDF